MPITCIKIEQICLTEFLHFKFENYEIFKDYLYHK